MWVIKFGTCIRHYWTAYHAEQFASALRSNGTPFTMETLQLSSPVTTPSTPQKQPGTLARTR